MSEDEGRTSEHAEHPKGALPFAEALSTSEHAPAIFERWRPWLALAAVLIVLAYGPVLLQLAVTTPFDAPGFRVW